MAFVKKSLCMLKRLGADRSGVAYLEFALALPFLLLLFAGSIDVTRMVLLHQKVDKAVFTVGDLATQLRMESGVCSRVNEWRENVVKDMVKPFNWEAGQFSFSIASVIGAHPPGQPNSSTTRDYMEWRNPRNAPWSRLGAFTNPYQNRVDTGNCAVSGTPCTIRGLARDERVIVTEMQYRFRPILSNLYSFTTTQFHKTSYFRSRIIDGRTGRSQGVLAGC